MPRLMPTWLIFAALGAIAITAVLVGLLYAVNLPNYGPEQRTGDGDGAGGE
jgi:hypothetical protein